MPSPRLFLITPPNIEIESFVELLDDTLSDSDVAILLLASDSIDRDSMNSNYKQIQQIAHRHNISALIQNNLEFANENDVDGIQIDELDVLKETLVKSKSFEIVGAAENKFKHDAMIKGEAEIDYMFFGNITTPESEFSPPKVVELSEWWAENFKIPGVALAGQNMESIREIATTGIEFIAVRNAIWNFPNGTKSAISIASDILSGFEVRT